MWGLHNRSAVYSYLVAAVIILFIALKISHLSLPYFWDEIGVFSRGINYQYHNSVSLFPNSVPPLVSRGHPLFFTALYAGYAKLIGSNSVQVVHSFSLVLSVILLLSVYYGVSKHYNKAAAFFSVALLAAQPLFIAQAGLALPEMLLALLIWWAIYTYSSGKYFAFIIFSCLGVLTKETAVLVPVVCGALTLWQLIIGSKKISDITALQLLSVVAAPLVFGAFLLIQKEQNGWYFFGYHIKAVKADAAFILSNTSDFMKFILYKQGRNQWGIIIAAGFIGGILFNGVNKQSVVNGFLPAGVIMVLAVIVFYSSTFYMNRYLLCLYPFITVMVGLSLAFIFKKIEPLAIVIVCVLCGASLSHLDDNQFAYDDNMAYVRTLNVTQQAMDYLADSLPVGPVYSNFPVFYAVTEFETGFKNRERLLPVWHPDSSDSKYLMISEFSHGLEDTLVRKFTVHRTFQDGYAKVNLMVKKEIK